MSSASSSSSSPVKTVLGPSVEACLGTIDDAILAIDDTLSAIEGASLLSDEQYEALCSGAERISQGVAALGEAIGASATAKGAATSAVAKKDGI